MSLNEFLPHSASSTTTGITPTRSLTLQRQLHRSQPEDIPSIPYEVDREGEPESLTPNENPIELPSQDPQRSTAAWLLTSQNFHAPKKPLDAQFMARMANLRQQTAGTSSTRSTPQTALLGTPASITSSLFSQSFSVASPPPVIGFPGTPVFTDQIPEGLMRSVEALSVTQTPEISTPRGPHPLPNSRLVASTQSLETILEVASCSTNSSISNLNTEYYQQGLGEQHLQIGGSRLSKIDMKARPCPQVFSRRTEVVWSVY